MNRGSSFKEHQRFSGPSHFPSTAAEGLNFYHASYRSRSGRQADDRALPGLPKPTSEGDPATGVRQEGAERPGQDHGAAVRGTAAGVRGLLGQEEVGGAKEGQAGLQGAPSLLRYQNAPK